MDNPVLTIDSTITLRDLFAGMAMQGLLSLINDDYEELARFYKIESGIPSVHIIAYRMADAMLKERDKDDADGSM